MVLLPVLTVYLEYKEAKEAGFSSAGVSGIHKQVKIGFYFVYRRFQCVIFYVYSTQP